MIATRPNRIVLVVAVLAALGLAGYCVSTRAADPAPAGRWEYAQLLLADGKQICYEADAETTIVAPLNSLSGNRTPARPSGDAYTAAVREVRNHDVGAMNLLGSRGWEAFAAVRTDRGTLVLLKRPQ